VVATRSIVTSQPDVTCDVCDRRLLRGEHPETFLAAGQRRTVCELCAPRATHEGWLRESGEPTVSVAPPRPRRGRNLFDRLRQAGRPNASEEAGSAPRRMRSEEGVYDALDDGVSEDAAGAGDGLREASTGALPDSGPAAVFAGGEEAHRGEEPAGEDGRALAMPVPASALPRDGGRVERAIAVFNAGEHPRRVAGVARSLGSPGVSVRPDKDLGSLVSIVITWELCWYRYGVDVEDPDAGARVLAQGTELSELAREERVANAVADELGALSLTAA
jgi:hypothetical protein